MFLSYWIKKVSLKIQKYSNIFHCLLQLLFALSKRIKLFATWQENEILTGRYLLPNRFLFSIVLKSLMLIQDTTETTNTRLSLNSVAVSHAVFLQIFDL